MIEREAPAADVGDIHTDFIVQLAFPALRLHRIMGEMSVNEFLRAISLRRGIKADVIQVLSIMAGQFAFTAATLPE